MHALSFGLAVFIGTEPNSTSSNNEKNSKTHYLPWRVTSKMQNSPSLLTAVLVRLISLHLRPAHDDAPITNWYGSTQSRTSDTAAKLYRGTFDIHKASQAGLRPCYSRGKSSTTRLFLHFHIESSPSSYLALALAAQPVPKQRIS